MSLWRIYLWKKWKYNEVITDAGGTVGDIELNESVRNKITIVGKYVQLNDAYISVAESLKHASLAKASKEGKYGKN